MYSLMTFKYVIHGQRIFHNRRKLRLASDYSNNFLSMISLKLLVMFLQSLFRCQRVIQRNLGCYVTINIVEKCKTLRLPWKLSASGMYSVHSVDLSINDFDFSERCLPSL